MTIGHWTPNSHTLGRNAMTHAEALTRFEKALKDAKNLIGIHGKINTNTGRRHSEMSLNRGAVVLIVAAWQSFIQDTAQALVDRLAVAKNDPAYPTFRVIKSAASSAIDRFSTPNAENTQELLRSLGLDPCPVWNWKAGQDTVTQQVAHDRMNGWLQVRHAIAHGEELGKKPIQHCVLTDIGNNQYSLRKANAERCLFFFTQVAKKTSAAGEALP
jgi:hypothetical protein